MTEQEYNELDGLRATVIKAGRTSMKHMRWAAIGQDEQTDAMRNGALIHMAVLEPDRYTSERVIWQGDKRTKAWKEFQADNDGKTIVTADDNDAYIAIQSAVRSYPAAARLLASGAAEQTLVWTGDKYGKGKCRLDWYNSKDNLWLDIKSTGRGIDERSIGRQIAAMSYDVQFGWYDEGFYRCSGVQPDVWIIAVESKPPYDVAVYQVPAMVVSAGRQRAVALATRYAECCTAGVWPGVQREGAEIVMPEWWNMESTGGAIVPDWMEEGQAGDL